MGSGRVVDGCCFGCGMEFDTPPNQCIIVILLAARIFGRSSQGAESAPPGKRPGEKITISIKKSMQKILIFWGNQVLSPAAIALCLSA